MKTFIQKRCPNEQSLQPYMPELTESQPTVETTLPKTMNARVTMKLFASYTAVKLRLRTVKCLNNLAFEHMHE